MSRFASEQTYDRGAVVRALGAAVLAVRLVLGWIYWGGGTRRFIYAPQKLDPHAHSWMANKFQSGMPGALLGLNHVIGHILHHPGLVYFILVAVSVVEVLCGLALIVGFLTRLSALVSLSISASLMLIFGWQGATCIDEWTMAVSTFSMGCTIIVAGGGLWSVDSYLMKKNPALADKGWFRAFGSGPLGSGTLEGLGKILGVVAIVFTLVFYNYFRGSIFTPFHGGPVSPAKHHISLTHATIASDGTVKVLAYLDAGTPAVPSHVVGVTVTGPHNAVVEQWSGNVLEKAATGHIQNVYIYNKFAPGLYGLKAKMGAKAWITLQPSKPLHLEAGRYTVTFHNINGNEFSTETVVK